jgi:hypothetical protein
MKKTILLTALLCAAACGAALFAQTTADEWFKKAGEYHAGGDYANAARAYSETVKRDSSHLDAYLNRGIMYYLLKNYDAAIADFDTFMKGASDFPLAYVLRGDAYGAKGVYHKAVADYRTGFEKGYEPSDYNIDKSSKADMWFCGAMYMEIVTNRFLGKPAVVTAYENRLKTVCDKSGVTRAEVEAFYRQNIGSLIATVVDAEFNKGMRGGVIPAVVYAQWKKDKVANGADALQIIKDCISNFYIDPTRENYEKLQMIDACYGENSLKFGDELARFAARSYGRTLNILNEDIGMKLDADTRSKRVELAQAVAKPNHELFVFSIRYGTR